MDRRTFLKTAAGVGAASAACGLATPAISQRAAARALRYVPSADLANFDPIGRPSNVALIAGALVWDTLYGLDARFQPQRQMVEAEEVSSDGLAWTFRLRSGLKFHDGEPVRASDAVASIKRWSVRGPMGQMIQAIENELAAIDDHTFHWVLRKPFPRMLRTLCETNSPCFVMPARIAATDPFRLIGEYVGSGPMRFVRSEWNPGAKAVFEKFSDYVPRQEPASWLAGAKRVLVDRIEWIVIPDPATAALALQTGEVDWLRLPLPELVPVLRKNRNLMVDIADPLGGIGFLRINHLHPPFNDVRARRAILMAMSQEDYMRSVFEDSSLWKRLAGFFPAGTPLYNEEGGEILKGERNFVAAKKLLADSNYAGQPITCLAAQDEPYHKAWGEVTRDLLTRLDMKVDYAAVDFGALVARREQKAPPSQGGWHMFPVIIPGSSCLNPANNGLLRANGTTSGWPESPQVEAEIAAWVDAKTLDEEKTVARRLNKAALDHVVYAPLGFFALHQAWRRNVTGITQGPLSFFWGVSKTG
jgi:peptide/nickel transport system substrate-binding protein